MSVFDDKAAEWDTPERRERAQHLVSPVGAEAAVEVESQRDIGPDSLNLARDQHLLPQDPAPVVARIVRMDGAIRSG